MPYSVNATASSSGAYPSSQSAPDSEQRTQQRGFIDGGFGGVKRANLDLTGRISTHEKIDLHNCVVRAQHANISEPLVKSSFGNVSVYKGGVQGGIQAGENITVKHADVAGTIDSTFGNVTLWDTRAAAVKASSDIHIKDGSEVLNVDASQSGNTRIEKSKVDSLKTSSGAASIVASQVQTVDAQHAALTISQGSRVNEADVSASEKFSIHDSKIVSTLRATGESLTIGKNASVGHLLFQGVVNSPFSAGGQDSGYVEASHGNSHAFVHNGLAIAGATRILGGINVTSNGGGVTITGLRLKGDQCYVGNNIALAGSVVIDGTINIGRQRQSTGAMAAQSDMQQQHQTLTLEDGASLESLSFTSQQCTMVLKGSATYEGDPSMPGLIIQRQE